MTNENLKQRIEEIGKREIAEGRFDGFFQVEEFNQKPCFAAGMDSEMKNIVLQYNPDYEKENPEKIDEVIRDVIRHEINHKKYHGFKGCPRNVENHAELIIEPIAEVLSAQGYGHSDFHYLANSLEDTVLQDDLTSKFTLDGLICFWDDVGRHNERIVDFLGAEVKLTKLTDFYEAHVKLNLYLWGNKKQKKKLEKYFVQRPKPKKNEPYKSKVKEVLQNFLKRTGIADLKQKINVNGKKIEVKDRQIIREFLNYENNWPNVARIYAEEFSKLMQPGYALPILNHSGKGTKGREIGIPFPTDGNPFDKEMYSPGFKKNRIQKAYHDNEKIPPWLDSFEALDLLYQSLVKKLNIKCETFTEQTTMPVYRYGKRPFDPERDNLKHVTFGFDDKGKIELKKKRWHEDMPLEYKVNPKGFPEVRFCLLDTSSSMKEDPRGGSNVGKTNIIPWGDNSKYHYALLSWYGLLGYLKQNHLLKQTNISLANFSNKVYIGQGLTEAKKIALKPQFGSTYINLDKIKSLFKNQGMLVFTVSDGEIANWDAIKNEFIKLAKQHHYFHLQIGSANEMTQDLKKSGLYVEYIKKADDLTTKVIDLTDNLYRGKK